MERFERAISEDMTIELIQPGIYRVKGKYEVAVDEKRKIALSCTCYDGQKHWCKHQIRVEYELRKTINRMDDDELLSLWDRRK